MDVKNQASPVEQPRPQISAVSRQRAANGDPRLSFETQQAIAEGAIPPTVTKPREKPSASETQERFSALQEARNPANQNAQNPADQPRTTVLKNEAVKVELSDAAKAILAKNNVQAPEVTGVKQDSGAILPDLPETSRFRTAEEDGPAPGARSQGAKNSLFSQEPSPAPEKARAGNDEQPASPQEAQARITTTNQVVQALQGTGLII